jgi:hypothetical protein
VTEFVIRPLADAFMQVGVYVAVLVLLFGALRWRYGERFTGGLTRRPRLGPLVGALLGVSPGCGGAIVLMPLYARGKVSFGTVVAALAATMGDSSWVVIAANPAFALKIHALLFVVGLVTGYAVDALGIAPEAGRRPRRRATAAVPAPSGADAVSGPPGRPAGSPPSTARGRPAPPPVPGVVPAGIAARLAGAVPQQAVSTAFWGLATPAFLVSVPVVFQAVDPRALAGALGGLDPYLLLGAVGTVAALLIFTAGRGRFVDDTTETAHARPLRDVLRHSAHEASFVTVWVAVAYLAWQAVSTLTGFDGSQMILGGAAGVLAGAFIGLVPGCAVQIVFTGLYVAGGLPLPTLVANAISQDGDALIPLAALRRRSAVRATVITTVPAVAVGLGLLALGW